MPNFYKAESCKRNLRIYSGFIITPINGYYFGRQRLIPKRNGNKITHNFSKFISCWRHHIITLIQKAFDIRILNNVNMCCFISHIMRH